MDPAEEWYIASANLDGQNGRIAFQGSQSLTTMVATRSAREASLHILSFVLSDEYCTQAQARTCWQTVARYAREQNRASMVMVINPFETKWTFHPSPDLRIVMVPGFFVPRVGKRDVTWYVQFFLINMQETDQVRMQTWIGREDHEFRNWLGGDACNYLVDFDQEYIMASELWGDRDP